MDFIIETMAVAVINILLTAAARTNTHTPERLESLDAVDQQSGAFIPPLIFSTRCESVGVS